MISHENDVRVEETKLKCFGKVSVFNLVVSKYNLNVLMTLFYVLETFVSNGVLGNLQFKIKMNYNFGKVFLFCVVVRIIQLNILVKTFHSFFKRTDCKISLFHRTEFHRTECIIRFVCLLSSSESL